MIAYFHSEQGKRSYQQDRFLVKENLYVVCDGMGGHSNGDLAAEAGIDRLGAISFDGSQAPCVLMANAIKLASSDCENSGDNRGSTVVAVYLDKDNNLIHFAHVGDSRIYLIKNNDAIYQITEDHSFRGSLESCLGYLTRVDLNTIKYDVGDRILLVSDGISGAYLDEMLLLKEINRAASEGWNPAEHLCHNAIDRGSTDNCTAILVEL